jgi:hypothetical protein
MDFVKKKKGELLHPRGEKEGARLDWIEMGAILNSQTSVTPTNKLYAGVLTEEAHQLCVSLPIHPTTFTVIQYTYNYCAQASSRVPDGRATADATHAYGATG